MIFAFPFGEETEIFRKIWERHYCGIIKIMHFKVAVMPKRVVTDSK